LITGNFTICQGQTTVLDAGSGFYFYLWSTNATTQTIPVSIAGVYSVTVTDANGCTGTNSTVITVNQLPAATVTATGSTSFCVGDSVLLTPTSGYVSYLWYRNFGPLSPQPATSWYYAKTRGNYYCVVTDLNGCTGSSNGIQVNVPCVPIGPAIEKEEESEQEQAITGILVYPNPSNDAFTIELTGAWSLSAAKATLMDASGRSLWGSLVFDETGTLTITGLAPGMYVLHVQSRNKNKYLKLIRAN
jgi:hypothetical protein